MEYKSILWYIRDGVLDWNYTGTIYFEDKEYTIVNGRVAYKKCRINKCEIDTVERTDKSIKKLTIALHTTLDGVIESFKERYYIVLLDSRGQNILSSAPVTESSTDGDLSFSATFISSDGFKMEATGKYALAVKSGDSFEILSNALYISNPEAMARQDGDFKDKYWGYYEGYKVYSKKGIQGADKAYTADLGVQHVLLNVDIQDLVSAGPQSG